MGIPSLLSYTDAHYGLFPKSIGQIIDHHRVQELHLTFTQGRWQYEDWGYPVAQSAGTGVELWAWMKSDDR
jgi:phosphatidylinositol glycan class T